jgi:hypothetical protein
MTCWGSICGGFVGFNGGDGESVHCCVVGFSLPREYDFWGSGVEVAYVPL